MSQSDAVLVVLLSLFAGYVVGFAVGAMRQYRRVSDDAGFLSIALAIRETFADEDGHRVFVLSEAEAERLIVEVYQRGRDDGATERALETPPDKLNLAGRLQYERAERAEAEVARLKQEHRK